MVTATITGGAALSKALQELSFEDERASVNALLKQAAQPIQRRASELAPAGVDAPHLKDMIVVQSVNALDDAEFGGKKELGDGQFAAVVGPSKDAFYGRFQEGGNVEFGGVKHKPQPFLRPAFDQTQSEVLGTLQRGMWALLTKLVKP